MSSFLYPVIDGTAPSWADIAVRATPNGGELIEMGDIAGISTGVTVEKGRQREGGRTIKRTRGSVDYEASWTLYADGYIKLIRGLMGLAPTQGNRAFIGLVPFLINVQWTPLGSNVIFEKRLKGCLITGDSEDSEEGSDAAQVEMTLDPIEICRVIDGVEILLV